MFIESKINLILSHTGCSRREKLREREPMEICIEGGRVGERGTEGEGREGDGERDAESKDNYGFRGKNE